MSEHQRSKPQSSDLVVSLDEARLMVIGPPGDIELLVARLTESIAQPGRGADASTIPPADMAALAATGVATLDASGRYVQLSSASLAAIKERMPDKTADGFYRMAVRGDGGRYAGQLVWKPANFNPVQAASLQTAAVGMALKMAIQDVQAAVARVEGKVDELLRLAKAERAGDVIGSFRVVSRIERHVSEGAPLISADWDSIAALGPSLENLAERLRQHLRTSIQALDTGSDLEDRADQIREVAESEMLGQTLRLLQVTEATLHLWQRLRLQRVRQVEPHLLMSAVESTREWYQEQAIADAQLMESVGKKLRDFGMQRPLEIHRPLSRRAVRKELQYVWADTAEFARARQGSIEALPEYEDPGVRDAFSQLRKEAGAARQAAREVSRSTAQIVGRRFKVAGRSLRTTAERANTRRHADREDD